MEGFTYLLNVKDFDYESSEQVRDEALGHVALQKILNNATATEITELSISNQNAINTIEGLEQATPLQKIKLERISDVPIYHTDPVVRRATSLQLTRDAKNANHLTLHVSICERLGLKKGDLVRVSDSKNTGANAIELPVIASKNLPSHVARLPAGTPISARLGGMFCELTVEKIS